MAIDLKFYRSISFNCLVFGRYIEFDPFGNIILDHEGGFSHRCGLGIRERPHPPGAGRDRRVEVARVAWPLLVRRQPCLVERPVEERECSGDEPVGVESEDELVRTPVTVGRVGADLLG